jgi:zinc protease
LGVLVSFGAAGACIVTPPPKAPGAEVVAYPMRQLELRNGLRVVLEQAPDFGTGGAVLMVGQGSAAEPPEQAGLAHLVEHLACEGKHAGVSLASRHHDLGANANAYTSWDETTFYLFDDVQRMEDSVTGIYAILTQPLADVDQAIFERERQVVADEMLDRTEDGTPGQALGWLMAAVFPRQHVYAHPVVGTAETLSRIGLAEARAFADHRYRADRSTLVVSAPMPIDELQALLERITGERPRVVSGGGWPDSQAVSPSEPPAVDETSEVHTADVPVPVLWIGWSVPSAAGTSGDLAQLEDAIFENNFFLDLEKRDRDIAALDAGVVHGTAGSLLYVKLVLKEAKHPERIAEMVADEVLARRGDFEALKRFTAAKSVYREENMVSRALNLAWSSEHVGKPTFLRDLERQMVGRSWQNIDEYARAYLGREYAHVVLVRPGAPERVQFKLASSSPDASPASSSLPPAPPAPLPAANSPARPVAGERGTKLLAKLETHVLANGLKVILLPRSGSPFHTVVLGFRGGTAQATPPGVLVAALWGRQRFDWSPDVFGLNYRYSMWEDSTEEVLRSTGSDVRLTLHYLGQLVGYQTFWPPQRFNDRLEVFEREDQAPRQAFERALSHAFYGTHPLGASPTTKDIQRITPGEVLRWVDRARRPRNAALVIVGEFDPQQALAAAETELGGWGRSAGPSPELPAPPPLERVSVAGDARVLFQNRPASLQAEVHFRCLLPPATADNMAARIIFRDSAQRTLFARLREQLGASYSVHASTTPFVGGTTVLDVTADVNYARLADGLRQMRTVLMDAGSPAIDQATFERARVLAARDLRLDTREMAIELVEMWNRGWPLDVLDRLPDAARAVRFEDVTEIAESCRESWVLGLLGDERRARAAWDEAQR